MAGISIGRKHRIVAVLLSVFSFAACGGGGSASGGSPPAPPPPPPPVVTANAGPDQTVAEDTQVQLSGSGSDSSGAALSYNWVQTSGPTVALSSPSAQSPSFDAPDVNIDRPANLRFQLTTSNGQGGQSQDSVDITVRADDFLLYLVGNSVLGAQELNKYDVALDDRILLSGPMTTDGEIRDFKLSPDGRYAAYLADQDTDEQVELYVSPTDGSGWQKVSAIQIADGDVSQFYEWAPDSSALYYVGDAETDNVNELYVVNPDGSSHMKINATPGSVGEVSWSPNSRYLAYVNANATLSPELGINVYDRNLGIDADFRTPGSPRLSTLGRLAWSPDSLHLAYVFGEIGSSLGLRLVIATPAGPETTATIRIGVTPVWSPDSALLAFQADPDSDGISDLHTIRRDGTMLTLVGVPRTESGSAINFAWSPDSSRIAYIDRIDSSTPRRLFTVLPDATSSTRISFNQSATSIVREFGWAPDNSRIAFQENPDAGTAYEIFTVLPDGSDPIRVSRVPTDPTIVMELGAGNELWAPDSSRLAWRAEIDSSNKLAIYTNRGDGSLRGIASIAPAGQMRTPGKWSADSSVLAYVSQQDDRSIDELYIGAGDSSMNQKVSGSLAINTRVFDEFAWSP